MDIYFSKIYHSKPFYKHKKKWFLLGVCFLFVMLRLPSLIEPYWYGDEGIYQVVAHALLSGRTLYKDIWDNKPPLLYILYASVNANLFLIKLLSLLSGLFSVIAFFFLSQKIFKKNLSSYLSTLVYSILFGLPLLEGNIANAENFMLLPIILAAYFIFSYTNIKKNVYIILAGFLLSVAFITKTVAVFDFSAFLLFTLLIDWKDRRVVSIKTLLSFIIPFLSLLFVCFVYFISKGAVSEFISSVFLQNVSYVGNQNQLFLPMGTLILKTVLLLILIACIIKFRKKLPTTSIFIYIWVSFALYDTFFSARPYTHYLLMLLPAFSLLVGQFYDKVKTKMIDGVVVVVIILLACLYFPLYIKVIPYYLNYINFLSNNEDVVDYQTFFDKNTPRDYDIANFIKTNVDDNESVFLWSDSAQIYALSNKLPIGKYIVAYHITFYKDADIIAKEQIEKVKPKYIIQTIDEPIIKDVLSSYQLRYIMEGAKIYEREI
jgi:4-amino-4-deoxy-L-arabinose transferase-like glycosyltransferase